MPSCQAGKEVTRDKMDVTVPQGTQFGVRLGDDMEYTTNRASVAARAVYRLQLGKTP